MRIGQTLFRHQAERLLDRRARSLVGTRTTRSDRACSARPSRLARTSIRARRRPAPATTPSNSSGTNLGPLSDKLLNGVPDDPKTKDVDESFAGVKQLVAAYRAENKLAPDVLVPADAVTRSASGLDPDITPANAVLQVARVAAARHLDVARVRALVERGIGGRDLGLFGEPRANVLELNLALDRERPTRE